MLKKTTNAEKKNERCWSDDEKRSRKKSKKLWILKKDYSKMKLVSCFRGLDCLSLRHLDDEKPPTIFSSKKKSKKLWILKKGKDAEKKKKRCWSDGIGPA